MNVVEILVTPQVLGLSAAIVAVLFGINKAFPGLRKKTVWRKILPLLPLALGVLGAFGYGLFGEGAEKIETPIITGLWSGFIAAHGRKIFKRIVLDKLDPEDRE